MSKTKRNKSTCAWKYVHRASGLTGYEARCNGHRLWATPHNWTKPTGPAIAHVTKGSFHKRFTRATLASAKAAAVAAAKAPKRSR